MVNVVGVCPFPGARLGARRSTFITVPLPGLVCGLKSILANYLASFIIIIVLKIIVSNFRLRSS